jgi:hypothetical protein
MNLNALMRLLDAKGTTSMRASNTKACSDLNESKIVSEIHKVFELYGPTFVDLAVGKRSDMDALLDFYDAPLRFIGDTFHFVMTDNAAITGRDGIGGELDRLRHAHFGASMLDKWDVKVLNSQAAVVDALWIRRDTDGGLISRFGVIYLVALTSAGWRITSAVNTSK